MTTRERIMIEIDKLNERQLGAMLKYVQSLATAPPRSGGLMQGLREIKIQGPVDFAENFDLYLDGTLKVT